MNTDKTAQLFRVHPWLNFLAGCSSAALCASAAQVGVVLFEPVVADGAEDVEIEGVFQRHGAVRHVGGNSPPLPLTGPDLPAPDFEAERALEDLSDPLALGVVFRHDCALGEEN